MARDRCDLLVVPVPAVAEGDASAEKHGDALVSASSITAGQLESDVRRQQQPFVGARHTQLRDLGGRLGQPGRQTQAGRQQARNAPGSKVKCLAQEPPHCAFSNKA
jgi:hypothetical protein